MNNVSKSSTILGLKRRPFIRDAATLQLGSAATTALGFISSVVFARVLGPDSYGTYTLIFSFAALLVTLTDWSGASFVMNTYLSRAHVEQNAPEIRVLLVYYVKMLLWIFLPLATLALLVAPTLAGLMYGRADIGSMSRFILLAGIFGSLLALVKILLESSRKMRRLTMIEVTEKIFFFLLPLALVLAGYGVGGAIFGHFLASAVLLCFALLLYRELTRRDSLFPSLRTVAASLSGVSVKKYFRFGVLTSVDKTIASVGAVLPLVIAGMFLPLSQLAFYKIAFSYVMLSSVLLKPVARLLNVQLPKSLSYGIKALRRDFYKATAGTTLIALLFAVPLLLAAPILVFIFYGDQYATVPKFINILITYSIVSATGYGVGALFRTLNRITVAIGINVLNIVIAVPLLIFALRNYGVEGFLWFTVLDFAAVMAASHLYFIYFFSRAGHGTETTVS